MARVAIDASALNVDREIELVAVDANGNQVPNVEIDPERARVRIAVARELANRTLPVVPIIIGQPAAGYRITSVTVEPLVVTVSGEEATVSQLETADTEPIDISGRNRDLEASVRIALPAGSASPAATPCRVIVTIGEDTGTRTFQVGIELDGEAAGCQLSSLSQSTVNVTLGGPIGSARCRRVAVADDGAADVGDVARLVGRLTPCRWSSRRTGTRSSVVSIDPTRSS